MRYIVKTDIGNFNVDTRCKNEFLIKESISNNLEKKFNKRPNYIILKEHLFKKQSNEDEFLFVVEKIKKLSNGNKYFKVKDYKSSIDKLGYIVSTAALIAFVTAVDKKEQLIIDNLFNITDIWNYRDSISFESVCKNLNKKQINILKRTAIQTGLNIDSKIRNHIF